LAVGEFGARFGAVVAATELAGRSGKLWVTACLIELARELLNRTN
jgi:hypothetical protein